MAGCLLSAAAAHAEPRLIVGRADAESLPGVSQAVLLIDGPRRVLTVRRMDGARPDGPPSVWRAVDPGGLRRIDLYGAPRLQRLKEPEPCEFALRWGALIPPMPPLHGEGEREQLAHVACAEASCERQAWQMDLASDALSLPLSAFLSQGESEAALVLYVLDLNGTTSKHRPYQVSELRSLPALHWRGRGLWWVSTETPVLMPLELAAHFPRIHQAVWDEQARQQGLAQVSLLYTSEALGGLYRRFSSRSLGLEKSDLQSLGVTERLAPLRDALLYRLQLRLRAADAPMQLSLQLGGSDGSSRPWLALESAQDDGAFCRDRLAVLSCAGLCHKRVERIANDPPGRALLQPRRDELPEGRGEQLQACRTSCDEQLKRKLDGSDNDGARQRSLAWQALLQGLEAMTGPGFFAQPELP